MILGIDLGTTNSAVGAFVDGKPQLIPNSLGKLLTPSVVGVESNGEIIIGEAAKERLTTHSEDTIASFKRYMGTSREFTLGGQKFRPEELSSFILLSLKKDAERYFKKEILEAIITVPAYFNDNQRKATRIAGELAGLKVEKLLNEPTAAALAYGVHLDGDNQVALVLDLGGGTFDVSILEMFAGIMEVRASAGDNFLGGDDFRQLLAEYFIKMNPEIRTDHLDRFLRNLIENEADKAKIKLSHETETTMEVPYKGKKRRLLITRDEFETLAQKFIERIQKPLELAIKDSRIRVDEITSIIHVGGATRMPMISQLSTKLFKRFPQKGIDPDLIVAEGASVQAAMKEKNQALKEMVLTDVCPYSLGIEIAKEMGDGRINAGKFLPIIERNTVVPRSRVESVYPVYDNQANLEINIYQGESYSIEENIFLGRLRLQIPTFCPIQERATEIRFTYDINGLLEVEAKVVKTGKVHKLIIEENPGVLSKEQVEKSLERMKRIKIHPRDQTRNKAILGRASRLYQEALGKNRALIGNHIDMFSTILDRQRPEEIDEACARFTELMDSLELNNLHSEEEYD